jgi:hypothetical protein
MTTLVFVVVYTNISGQILPLLFIGIIFVIIGIILDGLMPTGGSYSNFEFAFTQQKFATSIQPFIGNVYGNQLLLLSGGLHFIASLCLFLGMCAAVSWAANHDKTSLFGVQGECVCGLVHLLFVVNCSIVVGAIGDQFGIMCIGVC